MQDILPFSQACENNKQYILDRIRPHLEEVAKVVEIGGGTGQHAVFFASGLPQLLWQSTDVPENLVTLNQRIDAAKLPNLPAAVALDVNQSEWPFTQSQGVFSANTLHIMSESSVYGLFNGLSRVVAAQGIVMIYGPFKYKGQYTAPSNAAFDQWLKARDPESGIRDFEFVDKLAMQAGLHLSEDHSMPANNQLIVWKRV